MLTSPIFTAFVFSFSDNSIKHVDQGVKELISKYETNSFNLKGHR